MAAAAKAAAAQARREAEEEEALAREEATLDPEVAAARRALRQAKAKEREAVRKAETLATHKERLSNRAVQLGEGASALRELGAEAAGHLPEAAIRSFLVGGRTRKETVVDSSKGESVEAQAETSMLRSGTDLAIAQRRREVAERRMKQQKEAQLLNLRRQDLQVEAEALATRKAALLHKHAVANATAKAEEVKAEVEHAGDDETDAALAKKKRHAARAAAKAAKAEAAAVAAGEGGGEADEVALETIESAGELRARYLRTLKAQEAELAARQQKYSTGLQHHKKNAKGYGGEFGPSSYRTEQLDAYRFCRTVALELVGEILEGFADGGRPGPSIPQLTSEYDVWKRNHAQLEAKVKREEERRKAGIAVESESESESDSGDEARDEDVHNRIRHREKTNKLSDAGLYALAADAFSRLILEQASAVAREALRERWLADKLSRRVLLGSAARVVSGDAMVRPNNDLKKQLRSLARQRAGAPDRMHRHTLSVTQKWRGPKPRKVKRQRHADSSSSSSSEEEEEDGIDEKVKNLKLDDNVEEPKQGRLLRHAYIDAEGAYWSALGVGQSFIQLREAGGETMSIGFSPDSRHVAVGSAGGGIAVWNLASADEPPEARPPPRVVRMRMRMHSPEANGVTTLAWSADSSEIVTSDEAGVTRVWSLQGRAPALTALAIERANSFWRQVEQYEAAEAVAEARKEGDTEAVGFFEQKMQKAAEQAAKEGAAERASWEAQKERTLWPAAKPYKKQSRAERAQAGLGELSGAQLAPHLRISVRYSQLYLAELVDDDDAAAEAIASVEQVHLADKDEESGGGWFGTKKKKKRVAREGERELEELLPTAANFHPSFTMLGTQPSVVVCMRGGLVAKINRPGSERVVHSAPLFRPRMLLSERDAQRMLLDKARASGTKPGSEARRHPSEGSGDGDPALPSSALTREYFTGHAAPVICVGFREHSSVMVTLDSSGLLLEWPYRREHHSGHGWFRPSRSMQIGLDLKMLVVLPRSVKLCFPYEGLPSFPGAPTAQRGVYPPVFERAAREWEQKRIAPLRLPDLAWRTVRTDTGLVRSTYGDPAKVVGTHSTAEFNSITRDTAGKLLRHTTADYKRQHCKGALVAACFNPTGSEIATVTRFNDVPEGPQLRLNVLTIEPKSRGWLPLKITLPIATSTTPVLAIGPFFDVPQSDYAYLLVDNVLRIYSLGSGLLVWHNSSLHAPIGDELPVLDSLAVSPNGRHVAVGSAERQGFWMYTLEPPRKGRIRASMLKLRCGSGRAGAMPCEQRVREVGWYLGYDRKGNLNDHAHVAAFMQRTVLSLINHAVDIVDGVPDAPSSSEEGEEGAGEESGADEGDSGEE